MVDRKEKLVSVIVPVHNAEKYLEEAVESVRKQTYTDWELILVENGSADQSLNCVLYMKREIHGFGQSANQSEELQLPGTVGCRKPEEPD